MKISVIGGGASGITAAIFAKRENPDCTVTVFEKNDRILKKIHSTGNGRCNLTNKNISSEFYFSKDMNLVSKITEKIHYSMVESFFQSIGIIFFEENGRIYPYSRRANAVCDALRFEAEKLGVQIVCDKAIKKIEKKGNSFLIDGSFFDSVIISAGGFAAPMFGTDGNAFSLLKAAGHTVNPPLPALTPVKTCDNVKSLKGIRVQCHVKLMRDSKVLKEETGELQFTDYGLSGIVIMQLSRLCQNGDVLSVDFMPDYEENELYEMLLKRKEIFSERCCEEFFTGITHKPLSVYILQKCNIRPSLKVTLLKDNDICKVAGLLKSTDFVVLSPMGWNSAQTTSGGALLKEFSPDTLESKLLPGLYCTGETLDCVGDCGGYNLHWAWITGMIAGKSAAKRGI